jgi:hypothetical protein
MKTSILKALALVWLLVGTATYGADTAYGGASTTTSGSPDKKENPATTSPTNPDQSGVVVFNNTMKYLGQYFYSSNEFGDRILLSSEVTNRFFLRFALEYYLKENASGDEAITIRFYNNDGTNGIPKTLIYEMPKPVKMVAGFNKVIIEGLALQMPDTFTWTVQFEGINPGEETGLLFYNPPSIGIAYDDYWEKENNQWVLKKVYGSPANFGVLIQALVAGAGPPILPGPTTTTPMVPPPIPYASP